MNIEELREFEALCDAHYEYETSHVDAAWGYSIPITESSDIDETDIESMSFEYCADGPLSVYLGSSEMEIQLPRALTEEEADWFSRNTDYVVNGASDLAYSPYPSELCVVARLYEKE